MVKSAYCACRGPKFNAQHTFSGVTPAPGMSHSILERSQAAALTCAYHTVAHIPYSGAHTTLNQGRKIFLKNILNKAQVEVDASESLRASY